MGKRSSFGVSTVIIFILLLIPPLPALWSGVEKKALTPIPPFRAFNLHNSRGLPQSTVSVLTQDDRGLLWIGTMDGLGVFDGNQIQTVHSPRGGQEFLVIHDLKPRKKGGIYVGSLTGVFEYDGKDWRHLGLKTAVVSLIELENGSLWAVDRSGRIWIRETADQPVQWKEKKCSPDAGKIISAALAPDGTVVLAGSKGILHILGRKVVLMNGRIERGDTIRKILVTGPSACWIGTTRGRLYFSALSQGEWNRIDAISAEDGRIDSLAVDRFDRIWVGHGTGSVNFGNNRIGWTRWKAGEGYFPESSVRSIFADREGTVWFGLNGVGLWQLVSEQWNHRNFWGTSFNRNPSDQTPRAAVFGINRTLGNGLLICYWGQGVLHWEPDGKLRLYSAEQGITENNRFALEPSPGVIWVGGRFALFESEKGKRFKKILQVPSGFVYRAQQSPEGTWFVNTSENGIYSREKGRWAPKEDYNRHLPSLNVRGMTWLRNGELWLATMNGIVVFKGENYSGTFQLQKNFAVPRAVNCILERKSGEIWAAGFGGIGIRKNGTWRMSRIANGIPGKTIYSLAEAPDGSIWAGGSNGVGRFSDGHWQVYTVDTGLMGNECNLDGLFIDKEGDVWLGTMSSLARFKCNVPVVDPPELRVYWRNGFNNGDSEREMVLPRGQRSLKISWIAPWLKPERIEYRIRIREAGQELPWTFQQTKTEDFIDRLSRGSWEIQVQARLERSGEKGWTAPITARIEVPPFWWETVWFRILALLAGVAIVAFAFVLRTRSLKKRQQELKKSVDNAVAEIKVLSGLIPICAWCKKIRDDKGYWNQLEVYLQQHSEADFSHSICPECMKEMARGRSKKEEIKI